MRKISAIFLRSKLAEEGSPAAIILIDPAQEKVARKFLINEFLRGNGSAMSILVRSLRRFIKSGKIK